jgi:nitroreductase
MATYFGRGSVRDNITTPEKRAALESRFGLSRDQVPISLIAVGRPAAAPAAPPRQGIEQIVIRRP